MKHNYTEWMRLVLHMGLNLGAKSQLNEDINDNFKDTLQNFNFDEKQIQSVKINDSKMQNKKPPKAKNNSK